MSRRTVFFRLLRLAIPFWRWMALSVLLGFLTIASSIGLMATSAWVIAHAALRPSIADLQVAIVGVRAFGIARGLLRYLERLVSHEATFRLLAQIRTWFYRALEPLAPARLMQYRSGDLLARIVADVDTLENFYIRAIAPPLVAVLTAALMVVFLGGYDPLLAGVLLIFVLLTGIGLPALTGRLGRAPGRAIVAARADLNAALIDGVQGMADLVAFGAEGRQAARIREMSGRLVRAQNRMAAITGVQSGLNTLLVSWATLAVLTAAIPRVQGVDLAPVALAVIASFEALAPLAAAAQTLESNLAAARRLMEIVDSAYPLPLSLRERRDNVTDFPSAVTKQGTGDKGDEWRGSAGGLAIQSLRFRYAPDLPPALDGIDFTLPEGGRLAVVGPSGAGKSTLINLLLRFWDYTEGEILLGGRDLREIPQDDVRRQIGVVAQSTHLFNTTIRENLLLARPNATEADMIAAAQRAQIHTFIASLPDGYDTFVGEQGLRLSGGERQRIAIARALLKDAPILILDEATANLDAVTERAVMGAIHDLMAGRTTLIITHRLVGLEIADEILVMDKGRVVERGRHADLLAAGGLYRRLWELQNQVLAEQ